MHPLPIQKIGLVVFRYPMTSARAEWRAEPRCAGASPAVSMAITGERLRPRRRHRADASESYRGPQRRPGLWRLLARRIAAYPRKLARCASRLGRPQRGDSANRRAGRAMELLRRRLFDSRAACRGDDGHDVRGLP